MLLDVMKLTKEAPPALANRPRLREDCLKYRRAFTELSGRRGYNDSGLQPLEPQAVQAYIQMRDITDPDDVEMWMEALFAMDDVYIDYIRKRREKAQ